MVIEFIALWLKVPLKVPPVIVPVEVISVIVAEAELSDPALTKPLAVKVERVPVVALSEVALMAPVTVKLFPTEALLVTTRSVVEVLPVTVKAVKLPRVVIEFMAL